MNFRLLGLCVAAWVVTACQDDPVAVESGTRDLRQVGGRFSSVVLPGDSPDNAQASTNHNASTGGGPAAFVEYYPSNTVVTASASGYVGWTHDNGSTGGWGPGGYDNGMRGYAYLRQKHISPAATYDWSFAQYYYAGQWVNPVAYNITVRDSVFILRSQSSINLNSNGVYYCGPMYPQNPECFTHNGATTLTLTRATADLEFTADSISVAIGSTVKFKNRVMNPSVTGIAIPKAVLRYVWIPDDTSKGGSLTEVVDSSATACYRYLPADSTCTRVINGPGTLRIVARVNGKTTEKTVHVNAVPCPMGDSIADNAAIRKGLKELWQESNPTAQPTINRKERGMVVYELNGELKYDIVPPVPSDNACQTSTLSPPPSLPAGATLVAIIHTHPAKVNEKVQCTTTVSKKYSNQFGGPSPADWEQCTVFNPRIPCYVIDAANLYRMTNYPTSSQYWATVITPTDTVDIPKSQYWKQSQYFKKFSRKQGSCVRI